MLIQLRRSVLLAVVALILTFGYAYAGTGVSQLLFKHQANGSITANGSTLIGQNWSSPKWFHGRPDDTGPYAANPKATPPVGGGTTLWRPTATVALPARATWAHDPRSW